MSKPSRHGDARRALITGITGQDGVYLSDLLVRKGYSVFGLIRPDSRNPNRDAIRKEVRCLEGDLREADTIKSALYEASPDEIYNLAAESSVAHSFESPERVLEVNCLGFGRLVREATALNPQVRIYQASTSEMFGKSKPPQDETTPFAPVSPYATAKLRAHEDYVVGFREKGFFVCSGILFNHESPFRGENFVTRKITAGLARIREGLKECLELGNLDARRDWGFAGDYVKAMWLMLQQSKPEDFVIATGESRSVRDFVNAAANALDMGIRWQGQGKDEIGLSDKGKIIVRVNEQLYRPVELHHTCGDANKARRVLGWKPETSFGELVSKMVAADVERVRTLGR